MRITMRISLPTPIRLLIVIDSITGIDVRLVPLAELRGREVSAETGVADVVAGTEMVGHVGEGTVRDAV